MSIVVDESWLLEEDGELIESYLEEYEKFLSAMPDGLKRKECMSGFNRVKRSQLWSSDVLEITVKPGDICFIDYGQVYINESGYQHFGLVISETNHKIFVVPMTSNKEVIQKATREARKSHLYYIGKKKGLNRPSALFLNDCKFINSSRVISVNARIEPDSEMFKEITKLLKQIIFQE